MQENKTFFHFIFFFWCLDENRVFSYRTCIFIVQKYNLAENHRFFWRKRFEWAKPGPKGKWAEISPKIKWAYFLQGWTQPSPNHMTGYCSINFPVTVHMHSNPFSHVNKANCMQKTTLLFRWIKFHWTVQTQSKKLHSAGGYSSIKVGGLTVQVN